MVGVHGLRVVGLWRWRGESDRVGIVGRVGVREKLEQVRSGHG